MDKFRLTKILFSICLLSAASIASGQDYKILTVGFYNLENLFDTEDDPLINDEEFTPAGEKAWTDEKYREKLANMAYVISQIGIDKNPLGVSLLGVSEVENLKVLEDLVSQPALKDRHYDIVHYDSPDRRGIDVALLYNPEQFRVLEHDTLPFIIYNDDGRRKYTRNILRVTGILDTDTTHILVNHWPSRSGGEARSAPFRNKGAMICKKYIDTTYQKHPAHKFILLGDLNDDPTSNSVKGYLQAKYRAKDSRPGDLFNPMADYYRRGLGSNAYRDSWSLFDQVIISGNWLPEDQEGYFYYKAYVFNKRYLIQTSGRYKGYPYRTFSGDQYIAGYSDHFPVYAHFLKAVDR